MRCGFGGFSGSICWAILPTCRQLVTACQSLRRSTLLSLLTWRRKKQREGEGGECRGRESFWPCVFWVMRDVKTPLFNLLFLLVAHPHLTHLQPFHSFFRQLYLSSRVGCTKEELPPESVIQSSMNSILASAELIGGTRAKHHVD